MHKLPIAAVAGLAAAAGAGPVETYQGARIVEVQGAAGFNDLEYLDSLFGYTEDGLMVSINNHQSNDKIVIDGTEVFEPHNGDMELAVITRSDGLPFAALEFQIWNGWETDPSWVWIQALLDGQLVGEFDLDVAGPSDDFPIIGFEGKFDALRVGAFYDAESRDAHDPDYERNSLALDNVRFGTTEPACYPDFTGDGALDLFDFLGYVNAFNAEDPSADCDGSGALDLFDFLCFVNAFNEGCP